MKCLNDYQHELIISKNAGIKGVLWTQHLSSCEHCKKRHAEIQENIKFLNNLEGPLT